MSTLHPGDLHLWTFREGALAAVGHDLVLGAQRWSLEQVRDRIEVWVDATTVTPLGARSAGRLEPSSLSRRDRASIEKSLHGDVLQSRRHPGVWWRGTATSTGTGVQLEGTLELRGCIRPLALTATLAGHHLTVAGTLVPSQWGIPPVRALLGTLRVADRVEVRATVRDWRPLGPQGP